MVKYRLKTDDRIVCEAELRPGTRGRQYWYRVSYNDERLHGYKFDVPAEIFEASWVPVEDQAIASSEEVPGFVKTAVYFCGHGVFLSVGPEFDAGRSRDLARRFEKRFAELQGAMSRQFGWDRDSEKG